MEEMNQDMQPMVGTVEAKDDFAVAPPGHSLTVDNTKWAWGNPPVDVDPEVVLTKAINSLKTKKIEVKSLQDK